MKPMKLVGLLLPTLLLLPVLGIQEPRKIADIERYFPDNIGEHWTYRGIVVDQIRRVGDAGEYTNTATITGTTVKKGVTVKVFVESNQANNGPAESYFLKDKNGITYYGGNPTTTFETGITPYRVVPFPFEIGLSFRQLEKKGVNFGRDLDHDGKDETADVVAEIKFSRFETITVPAGTFKDSLRTEGLMDIAISLSKSGRVVHLIDRTTNWFAYQIGLIKGIERTEWPVIDAAPPRILTVTEELEEFAF